MSSDNERLRELDQLIRAAHAELGTLQFLLINAYERELNPAELGMHIANLGQQMYAWERERRRLPRQISEAVQPATVSPQDSELAPKPPRSKDAVRSRRAVSLKRTNSRHQTSDSAISLDLQYA